MRYSADYEGARFFKADLQLQTPADTRHWEDLRPQLQPLATSAPLKPSLGGAT